MIISLKFLVSFCLLLIYIPSLSCRNINYHKIQRLNPLTFLIKLPQEKMEEITSINGISGEAKDDWLHIMEDSNRLKMVNEDESFVKYEYLRELSSQPTDQIDISEGKIEDTVVESNLRPIIGILTQEIDRSMEHQEELKNFTSYIAASYVKFIESAGARVVPVLINQNDLYYETMAKSLNGFLFPGGGLPVDNSTGYGKAGKKIFDLVKEAGATKAFIPLWGTCLGFEMLMYLASGGEDVLSLCSANNRADKLIFDLDFRKSKLFENMSYELVWALQTQNITSNFHKHCTLPETFKKTSLGKSLRILSTSLDEFGVEYVSTVEHKSLPIFGTQWHPEKATYEWANDEHHSAIPHDLGAVRVSQAIAEVFVQEARKNMNKFDSKEEEMNSLIYNYQPIYVQPIYGSSFEQCYYFD